MKRHEREIRELLEKMDSFLPDSPPQERASEREPKKKVVGVMPPAARPIPIRKSNSARFGAWLREHHIGAGLTCIILAFVLAIGGMIVLQNFRGAAIVGQIMVAVGALLFLYPILFRFFAGRDMNDSSEGPKYWRGQSVDDGFSWQTVRRWFQSRNRPNNRNRQNR